ncbi:hypothetical protein AA313_de0207742 [Arthrobotrys entomopaga]|nr:hypothetical protein AA313_de0207742 [Arthrobotrys entomopaga]
MEHEPSRLTENRPNDNSQDPYEVYNGQGFKKVSNGKTRGKKWMMTLGGTQYRSSDVQDVATVAPHSMGYVERFYASLDSLDHPGIDVTLAAYKHCILNPNEATPKPWRFELSRIFYSLPSQELQKGYIDCYALGYNEQNFWYSEVPRSFEQAFMFGQLERQWDEDIKGVIFRRMNGISEEGEVDGIRRFVQPGDLEDPDSPDFVPGGPFVPRHRMPVWERVRVQYY